MIKEIFFPAKIGTHRIYSQRILGFAIQENTVSCVQTYAKRGKTIVEKLFKEKIEQGTPDSYTERTALAIKQILPKVDKYDLVRISIPASLVVFKELEVPFKETHKIRMILEYEIEPMLPFSIEQAITDFIITKQTKNENKSQILAATVRQQDLSKILEIYTAAGIEPTNITIDLFAIYNLYQQIPEYKNIKNASAIVDLGLNATRIAFLQDGELRLTRAIPKGIDTVAKSISNETNIPFSQIKGNTEKFGLQEKNEENYDKSLKKHMIDLFHDIQFTLNSFSLKLGFEKGISKIIFTGPQSNLKNLTRFCNELFQTPCEIFACEKIFVDGHYKNKTKEYSNNWTNYVVALGTALPSIEQSEFDLRKKAFSLETFSLISKQIIAASIIILVMFTTIFIKGFLQVRRLSNQIKKIERRETSRLRKMFPPKARLPKEITFQKLIRKAKDLLSEKLEMWSAFEKEKLNPILILQELTNIIDKRRFDVTIESVYITEEEKIPKVEVEGIFRSKTGSDHFLYFMTLEKRFEESKILELEEGVDSRLEEDKGIKFTAKLKLKEMEK